MTRNLFIEEFSPVTPRGWSDELLGKGVGYQNKVIIPWWRRTVESAVPDWEDSEKEIQSRYALQTTIVSPRAPVFTSELRQTAYDFDRESLLLVPQPDGLHVLVGPGGFLDRIKDQFSLLDTVLVCN